MSAPSVPNIELRPWPEAGAITFYWLPPSSDGGSPILNYTLACTAIAYSQDLSANTPFYKVTGLTNGIEYTFTLTATNAIGTSPAATFRSVQPGGIPFGPTQAIASTINTSTALVTWNNPSTIANEGASKWFLIMTQPGSNVVPSTYKAAYIYERARTFQLTSTAIAYRFLVQSINDTGYCPPFAFTSSIFGTVVIPFSPSSISGIQVWYDGADPLATGTVPTNGTTISTFFDKSGFGRNATGGTPVLSTNSLNNQPTVLFSNGNGYNITFPSFPTTYSIFSVFRNNTTGSYMGLLGASNTVYLFIGAGGSTSNLLTSVGNGTSWNDLVENTPTVNLVNNNILLSLTNNNTTLSPFVNGSAQSTKMGVTASFNNFSFGKPIAGVSAFNGNVAEMIIYTTLVSQYSRQQIEGYMAWKWGLQSNLPVVHPFRNAAPTANDSTFYPTQVTGIRLWIDAQDSTSVSTSGVSTVVRIRDKSGFGFDFSNVVGYGRTPSSFNTSYTSFTSPGTSGHLLGSNASFTIGHPHFVFFVGRNTKSTADFGFIYNAVAGSITTFKNSGETYSMYAGTQVDGVSIGSGSSSILMSVSYNGANSYFTQNGTVVTSNVNAGGNGSGTLGMILGQRYSLDNFAFGGEYCELLMYSNTLNLYNRQQVEGYLAWKWGMQTTLYVGHPFRYAAPVNSTISFVPTMASNLQGWYDGADPAGTGSAPTNGSTITTWVDKSQFRRNATAAVAGNYSTTDGGYIRFSNSNYYLMQSTANALVNSYYTIFLVERLQTNQFESYPIGGSNGATNTNLVIGYRQGSSYRFANYGGTLLETSGFPAYTTPEAQPIRIWANVQNASSRFIILNGSTIASDTNNTLLSSWLGANIGGVTVSGNTNYYVGNLHEALFFNGQISTFTRQQVEGYLAWKWNLQSNLPLYHPFRNAAPTTASLFSPNMLNGLTLWLDAADTSAFTLSGSNVTQWRDKSGLNNHFSSILGTASRALDSTVSTVIIPSSTVMECANSINITTSYSILAVTRITGIPAGIGHFMNSPSGGSTAIRYQSLTSNINSVSLRGAPSGLGTDVNDWITTINVNGSQNATTAATYTAYHMFDGQIANAPGSGKPCISGTFGGRYYAGNICEILIFSSTLSTADRQALQGYLAWKWGLQTLLPSTHPYRSAAPTSSNV